jgi:hypothetical protein
MEENEMASGITICKGATIGAAEVERVQQAMAELAKDPHAPREITLKATLHVHREYPKTLYKGKEIRQVADASAEKAAVEAGFGPYEHESFTAKEA